MTDPSATRRLATIVAADVVGYSRLVGQDEAGTVAELRRCRDEVVDPAITAHDGRIANTAGDSVLIEFTSLLDGVTCAVAIQAAMATRNAGVPEDRGIRFRIGINIGDVIERAGDILGDGVNLAARLEGLAPAGGICVSESVRNALGPNAPGKLFDLGPQTLKNIERPVRAYLLEAGEGPGVERLGAGDQARVGYCMAVDDISLAHTTVGSGYPLVIAGAWMTHLEREWDDPAWCNYLAGLGENFRLIRYDQRGNGMSDWDRVEIGFERMVDDYATIIDLYGHEKVALWGNSQGAAVAAAYAARNPDRVSHLILYGGYARGRRQRRDPEAEAESVALVTLIRQAWGRDNPAIRQTMTSMFMPDATAEEAAWFNNFQRACGPAENIARFREVFDSIDITAELDRIVCPTLVIHCAGDAVAPLAEGRLLAARIANARLVVLDSDSHMMTGRDPEFARCLDAVRDFMAEVIEAGSD